MVCHHGSFSKKSSNFPIPIHLEGVYTEALMLWPSDRNNQLIGKDLDVGKIEGRRRRGMTEDEMVGWHH